MLTIFVVDLLENVVKVSRKGHSSKTFQHGPVVCILWLVMSDVISTARDCRFNIGMQ